VWAFVNIKLCISLLGIILIGGCAGNQGPSATDSRASSGQPRTSDRGNKPKVQPKPAKITPTPPKNSAAKILLAQANIALKQQGPAQAIVLLERAIRIDPREALLWIRLSQAHLEQGHTTAASQHARKAIALAGSDAVKTGRAWLQMADVLEAQGERQQAASLRRKYARYAG
jgi:Tfp pilus assembly protein PilF|tara:strand:+ start:634 stop:1149 length:516 start_codon:yes stop_codon:yes gene_type:complete